MSTELDCSFFYPYGDQMRALLSAEVEINSGKYGCHLTDTTLSSCFRALTTSRPLSSYVSAMMMFLSKPAEAT